MTLIHVFMRVYGKLTGWIAQLIYFKRKTYYEDKSSQSRLVRGGALVISNHYSVFDYFVNFFVFFFRKLYVVSAEFPYRRGRFIKFGMDCVGGICVDRDRNGMRFVDDTVRVLRRGGLVQIFPEAHITPDGEMHEFKTSYIIMALHSGAPIIPVMSDGNYGWKKRTHIIIGKKIYLSDYCKNKNPTREEINELNAIVYGKAKELLDKLREYSEEKGARKA